MPISEGEDLDRIATLERWRVFNRDPSSEHWQNIDSLMHQYRASEETASKTLDEHEQTLDELERDHEARTNSLRAELDRYEEDLLASEKRARYLERVARAQANLLQSQGRGEHTAALEQGLADLATPAQPPNSAANAA